MNIPLTLENLTRETALVLATDEGIASLAAETQSQADWLVNIGWNPAIDNDSIPAPLAVVIPLSESQALGSPKSMHVKISLWLHNSEGAPEIINQLYVFNAVPMAAKFSDTIEAALRMRFGQTDAKLIVFDKQFDFNTWFESGLVNVTIDMAVELARSLGRSFLI